MTLPDHVEIDDPDAAELFMDSRALYILPFVTQALSVREAAATLGLAPSTLRPWVRRFLRARLLVTAGEVDEHGGERFQLAARTVRVVGRRVATLDEFLRLHRPWWVALAASLVAETARQSDGMVTVIRRTPSGQAFASARPARRSTELGLADLPPMVNKWGQLSMGPETARAFQAELEALLTKFTARQEGPANQARYLFHLGLVPDHSLEQDV